MLCEMVKKELDLSNAVVVSPDAGFAKQARKFAAWLELPSPSATKQRTDHTENAQVLEILGDVEGKNCRSATTLPPPAARWSTWPTP